MTATQLLIDEFCNLNELPAMQLSAEGRCQMLVDDRLMIYFVVTDENALLLSVGVGQLDKEGALRNRGLELLAKANYYGLGTGGQTLALCPDDRQLVLFGRQPLAMLDATSLTYWFHDVVNNATEWQARFAMLDADVAASVRAPQVNVSQLRV